MTDPITAGFAANVASALTMATLGLTRKSLRQAILGTPKEEALRRCYQAAAEALLPQSDPLRPVYAAPLRDFLNEQLSSAEFAKLIRGQEPDLDTLVEAFEDEMAGQELPPFDFQTRIAEFVQTFLLAAEQETALAETIRTAQLREATRSLRDLAGNVEAILQALQTTGYGNVTAQGDVRVEQDLVTGIKIGALNIHLRDESAPADPCADLGPKYLRALRTDVVQLPLAALDDEGADSRSPNVTLDRVYIGLNTQRSVPLDKIEKEQPEFRFKDERPVSALQAAAQNERLVLLGDPGSGKSVFVNHLAFELAQTLLTGQKQLPDWPEPPQWPVRFILRDLAAAVAGAVDLTELVRVSANRQNKQLLAAARAYLIEQFTFLNLSPAEAEQWYSCLSRRSCLTIFDGLDEVPLDQLPWLRQLIELIDARHKGPIIVTCRIRSYQAMPGLAGFSKETLAPFTEGQMDDFIERWYQAQPGLTEATRQDRMADLQGAVRELPSDLTRNPLLLTTLALIHTTGTELPKQRAVLYKRGVEVLIRRWQKHKHGAASLLEQLEVGPDRLLEGLRALAFEAHQAAEPGETADVDEDRAVGLLARVALGSRAKAEQFLAYVDRQAGLLVGRGGSELAPPVYRFAHRTF